MNEMLATPVRSVIECIESWHDENGNWYRIYSDGFIEQGGVRSSTGNNVEVTVTLHKPYTTTNYHVSINITVKAGYYLWPESYNAYNKTTTNFQKTDNTDLNYTWYACGY